MGERERERECGRESVGESKSVEESDSMEERAWDRELGIERACEIWESVLGRECGRA